MEYDLKKGLISFVILLVGTFIIVSINASNLHSTSIAWENIYLFLTPIFSLICFVPLIFTKNTSNI